MTEYGKIPPQAVDLEEAVLGALLIEPGILDEISGILSMGDFYKANHQTIFHAIHEMSRDNQAIDILTVTEHLSKKNNLEEVGGPLFITKLSSKVATAGHVQYHAQILKQKSIQRQMIGYATEILRHGYDTEDPDDLLQSAQRDLEKLMDAAYGSVTTRSFKDILNGTIKNAETRETLNRSGQVPGIKTPIADLTRLTQGWQPGSLTILAGRPSMGKTAIALATTKTAAKSGKQIVFFSLEMTAEQLCDRILLGETEDLDPERYASGRMREEDWKNLESGYQKLENLGIHIQVGSTINADFIRSRSRILRKRNECDLVVIDYLQLIDGSSRSQNREQEIAKISRQMKNLATELNIPVILLSQLNRMSETRRDKRPQLSDLRESGAIEQDADLVGLLYRPEYYGFISDDQDRSLQGIGQLLVEKNRHGRTGTIYFKYNPSLTRIYDVPKAGQMEPVTDSETQNDLPF